ncbi:MAG: hypothetical protein R3E68_03210 [Burkholderiaceae bacterium]
MRVTEGERPGTGVHDLLLRYLETQESKELRRLFLPRKRKPDAETFGQ